MNILSIDPGRYSIKFTSISINRKDIQINDQEEIFIDHKHQASNDYSYQIQVIQDYLSSHNTDDKISFCMPSELMSYRFIQIPIKNIKKAEKTIPFQVEDSLPYSLAKVHLAYQVDQNQNNGCDAQVALIQKEDFQKWIDAFETWPKKISYLGQGAFSYPHFFNHQNDTSNILLIDIGHFGSRGYFINKGELADSNYSYFGGNKLTENISEFYKIDYAKAQEFKHHNGFFLTNNLKDNIDKDQKAFGQLMHQSSSSFVQELRRWVVNYKMTTKGSIERVLLTGSGSLCENFDQYLAEQLDAPVFYLDSFININQSLSKQEKLSYNNSFSIAASYKKRNKLANLLTGEFATESDDDIPVHSMSFFTVRVCLICLLFIFTLSVERYLLQKKEVNLNRSGNKILKNPALAKAGIKRRSFKRSPQRIERKLKSLIKGLKDEESALVEANLIDGVTPLVDLSKKIRANDLTLDSWESSSQEFVSGIFKSEKITALYSLKKQLESSDYSNLDVKLNSRSKQLSFRYDLEVAE